MERIMCGNIFNGVTYKGPEAMMVNIGMNTETGETLTIPVVIPTQTYHKNTFGYALYSPQERRQMEVDAFAADIAEARRAFDTAGYLFEATSNIGEAQ